MGLVELVGWTGVRIVLIMSDEDRNEEKRRIRALFTALAEEVVIGLDSIEDEMQKDAANRDVKYMVGVAELNVALRNALVALEQSGLLHDDAETIDEVTEFVNDPVGFEDDDEDGSKLN